jgi:glycosyltransferase involved in cell wall biosynthesis
VRVGWSGSVSTVGNLQLIAGPLRDIAADPSVRLTFIGSAYPPLEGLACDAWAWHEETEVEDLSKLDVGLLPIPVNEWNKRKFFLKLVQYMALGIPAVATPLGSVPDVLEHGVTGFIAETPEEWRDYVGRLVADASLRRQMGQAAAAKARRCYTVQANADAIVEAFRLALP